MMARLPIPGSDKGTWGDILNEFLSVSHEADGGLKSSAVVKTSGDQTIAGVKTFSSSPIVPTPTSDDQAANKQYVDDTAAAGAPDADALTKGIVQLAGDLSGTAASPQIAAGAIVNADINASAAIAQSKIANLTTDLAGKADTSHSHNAADVTDFDTEVSANADVAANTVARHTHSNSSVLNATTASFTTTDETKLDGIESGADVTDATNVSAAGAVMTSGSQTVAGVKTFSSDPIIPDEAYDATAWNGVLEPATKNAIRDKLEGLPQAAAADPTELGISTVGVTTTFTIEDTIARQDDVNTALFNQAVAVALGYQPKDIYAEITAHLTAVNNSTAMVDATGLSVALAANSTYIISSYIIYRSSTTADIKFGWTVPAGVSGIWDPLGPAPSVGSQEGAIKRNAQAWSSTTASLGGAGATLDVVASPGGRIRTGGTAGTLQLQYAQLNLEVSDTQIRAYSWVKASKVA